MRLDKYIWSVRLKKTRSIASKDCSGEKVLLNGEVSKPGKNVKVGDEISIKMVPVWLNYRVKGIPKSRVGAKLVPDYLEDLTEADTLEQLEQIRLLNRQNKVLGIKGRPTKRDRRNLDRLTGE